MFFDSENYLFNQVGPPLKLLADTSLTEVESRSKLHRNNVCGLYFNLREIWIYTLTPSLLLCFSIETFIIFIMLSLPWSITAVQWTLKSLIIYLSFLTSAIHFFAFLKCDVWLEVPFKDNDYTWYSNTAVHMLWERPVDLFFKNITSSKHTAHNSISNSGVDII